MFLRNTAEILNSHAQKNGLRNIPNTLLPSTGENSGEMNYMYKKAGITFMEIRYL
jgi:hypothetical protein